MPAVGKGNQRRAIEKEGVSTADKGDEADLRHQRRCEMQQRRDSPEHRDGREENDGQCEEAEGAVPATRPADSDRDTENDEGKRVDVLHEIDDAFHCTALSGPESVERGDLARKQADELGIPLPSGSTSQDGECIALRKSWPVRAVVGKRVERITLRDDPRQKRDSRAPQAVGVTVPIECLVVMADDWQ